MEPAKRPPSFPGSESMPWNICEGAPRRNQTGEGWFLTGEMVELIHSGVNNIVCTQPFGCLPNHVVGKGVIKELRRRYPMSNIVAIDYDPGASEVNQLNRIKLMLSTAQKNLKTHQAAEPSAPGQEKEIRGTQNDQAGNQRNQAPVHP